MQMSMGPRFLTVSEKHCSTAGSSVMSMLWVVMVVENQTRQVIRSMP